MDIRVLLEKLDIRTRIAPCELEVLFEKIDSENKSKYEKEFTSLAQQRQSAINQWLMRTKSRNRLQETDEVLLEILVELYQKVENLERMLHNKAREYIKLDSEGVASFVGHNVLCMSKDCFKEQEYYYMRLFLPVFPQRYIGIFAKALHPRVVSIENLHHNDMSDFDSFVADMERLMILDSKSLGKKEE